MVREIAPAINVRVTASLTGLRGNGDAGSGRLGEGQRVTERPSAPCHHWELWAGFQSAGNDGG